MKTNLLIILIAAFTFACNSENKPSEAEAVEVPTEITLSKAQLANVDIVLGTPSFVELPETMVLSGTIDVPPQNISELSSTITGFVKDLKVYNGTTVKAGEILCYLEHPSLVTKQKEYYSELKSLALAVKDEQRQTELLAQNAGSARKLELAKETVLLCKQKVSDLESQLKTLGLSLAAIANGKLFSRVAIIAPNNAFVKEVKISENQQIMAGASLFTLVDKSHVHLELTCNAEQASKLKEGMEVIFYPGGNKTTEVKASLYLSGKIVDKGSGLVNLHAHLENEHSGLLPGTTGEAMAFLDKRKQNSIPADAVMEEDGITYVFTAELKNDSVKLFKTPVKLFPEKGGYFPLNQAFNKQIVVKNADIINAELNKGEDEE